MESQFWINKWQEADIAGFNQDEVNANLVTYSRLLALKPGDTVFVPLCGKSIDMIWLAQQGYHVVGVELSDIACHDFFAEHHLKVKQITKGVFQSYQHENIEIFCGDFFKLTLADLPTIQGVYDRAAMIALPEDIRHKYVNHLMSLIGNASILLEVVEGIGEIKGPPFPVYQEEISSLYSNNYEIKFLRREVLVEVPPIMQRKGYVEMREADYLLVKK